MKATRHLTSTFSNVLPSSGTLTAQSLSKAHREPLRGVARGVLVAIGISLLFVPNAGSTSTKEYISYKEYSLYLLDFNYKQFNCLDKLYTKESNWRPEAKNGSHNGIPQGRSEYLATLNGYDQVQWGLNYIANHRMYQADVCKAWAHMQRYGWH